LELEKNGQIEDALKYIAYDYLMTWMYYSAKIDTIFPTSSRNAIDFMDNLAEVYQIKGRSYEIKNIAGTSDVVMIELVESYEPSPGAPAFRTPLVLVLEFSEGKVRRGRHYCDPAISHLHLSQAAIDKAFNCC
jgi:ketosteroid isomerase-like protein